MAPLNPNPPPRAPNMKKFAESRSRELESLHSVISDRLNRDFKIHRSKWRRTTGYRSSKHKIRNSSVSGFVTSGDGTRRLRTHLWHVKRFTMVRGGGFICPLGFKGEGERFKGYLETVEIWSTCT